MAGERVSNLVFMGMGEPLANFANLAQALEILNAPWGVGIGARRITVSTSGLAPQIRQLAEMPLQFRLAISLHGATDEVRQQIMPVNRKFPLPVLDAAALVKVARRVDAKVNCIPYNTVEGLDWRRPGEDRQDAFMAILRRGGVTATIRREKGHDIAAACGQLRRQNLSGERPEPK